MRAWPLAVAVALAGCDTSLNGFHFSCGPDAGCPTGEVCQAGLCAAPGGSGSSGGTGSSGGSASGSSGAGSTGAASGGSGSGSSSGAATGSGSSSSGGGSSSGVTWRGSGTSGCVTGQGTYSTEPSLGSSDLPAALAFDATTGNLLVLVLPGSDRPELFAIAPDGGLSVPAPTITGMGVPAGVVVDPAGNVFMLDDSGQLFELAVDGGAPAPLCQESCVPGEPTALALGPGDTLYVTFPTCVMSWSDGITATVAGNCNASGNASGPATTVAEFEQLKGIAVDPSGWHLVVADGEGENCLREIDLDAGLVSDYGAPCASQPFYTPTTLGRPWGLAEDGVGNLFVTDEGPNGTNTGAVWEVTPGGKFIWVAGGGTAASSSGPACGVELSSPDAITVNGSTDDLYVLDQTDPARIVELLP